MILKTLSDMLNKQNENGDNDLANQQFDRVSKIKNKKKSSMSLLRFIINKKM